MQTWDTLIATASPGERHFEKVYLVLWYHIVIRQKQKRHNPFIIILLKAKARAKDLTLKAKDRTKDLTLKAKDRTKDLTFKAKARTKDLTLKAKDRTTDLTLKAKDRTKD